MVRAHAPSPPSWQGASLHNADLSSTTLHGANFSGADLAFAKLTMITEGRGIIFDGAVLEGASFTDSSLDNASFVRASLRKAPHPALTPPPHTRSARATALMSTAAVRRRRCGHEEIKLH